MLGAAAGSIIIGILISSAIAFLWKALSDLSSLTILFLISISIPGTA